jgi:hypothetical protein
MRNAWVIGIVALWIILTLLSNVAEKEALMGQVDPTTITADNPTGDTQVGTLDRLMGADFTSVATNGNPLTIISAIGKYFINLMRIVFLYYPVIWQGAGLIIYFVLFMPISIGFVVALITIIRGVPSL